MSSFVAHQLSIGYDNRIIAQNLSLSAKAGKLYVLLGRNGAGKSTLLRTLAGIQKPISGHVVYMDNQIDLIPAIDKSKLIGVVLTGHDVPGLMTVRELVSLGRYPWLDWMARTTPKDHEKIEGVLKLTHLSDIADRFFHELSDGQKQKAVLARAIAQDTPLILMDEPSNHLDLQNRNEVAALILDLVRNHGKTVIMSTHDVTLAVHIANEIWLLENGNIFTGLAEDMVLSGQLSPFIDGNEFSRFSDYHSNNSISVSGDGKLIELIEKALAKNYFKPGLSPKGGKIEAKMTNKGVSILWDSREFTSIAALVDALNNA